MQLVPMASGLLALAGTLGVLAGLATLSRTRSSGSSARWLKADLDRPYAIDRRIYHHHRKAGIALIAAAAWWLWLLSPLTAWGRWLGLTRHYLFTLLHAGVVPPMLTSLLALLALIVGCLLLIRPSLLKPFERMANRSIHLLPQPGRRSTDLDHRSVLAAMGTQIILGFALLSAGCVCLWVAWQLGSS